MFQLVTKYKHFISFNSHPVHNSWIQFDLPSVLGRMEKLHLHTKPVRSPQTRHTHWMGILRQTQGQRIPTGNKSSELLYNLLVVVLRKNRIIKLSAGTLKA